MLEPDAVAPAVIVGLDGGYVRSRHPRPERNFEVVAGEVIGSDGIQHRFAFPRNGQSVEPFARALARTGVRGCTPATVVLDWFHIAMRFQHALQTATGLKAETINDYVGTITSLDSRERHASSGRSG